MKTKTQFALVNEMNRYYLDVYEDGVGVPDTVVVDVGDGRDGGGGESFEGILLKVNKRMERLSTCVCAQQLALQVAWLVQPARLGLASP